MWQYELPSRSRVFSETPLQSSPEGITFLSLVPLTVRIWVCYMFVCSLVLYRILEYYPIYLQPFGTGTTGQPRRDETDERPLSRDEVLADMANDSLEFYEWLRSIRRSNLDHDPFDLS